MKTSLKIECIGDNNTQFLNFWKSASTKMISGKLTKSIFGNIPLGWFVAEILGFHPQFNYERKFLRYKKSYKNANSTGSRGVYAFYILESDKIYDVKSPYSWAKSHRYFCTVGNDGEIKILTKEEVDQCLKNRLA